MNEGELTLSFRIAGINTTQFALVEENYSESEEVSLGTSLDFGIDIEKNILGVEAGFQFTQNEALFLHIVVQCGFEIEENAWTSLINENTITVPNFFASHLAAITVGVTRGVLHEKTNDTIYNQFIIPTTNITELVADDVVIDMEDNSEEDL